MPLVILLDVSLSMMRTLQLYDTKEEVSCQKMAVYALNQFLSHMAQNCKLEFTTLVVYSSLYEVLVPFTRDYDSIKVALHNVEVFDKTSIGAGFEAVNTLILEEWGVGAHCQVLLVTDGNIGFSENTLFKRLTKPTNKEDGKLLPFLFPCKLHVLLMSDSKDPVVSKNVKLFQKLTELNGHGGEIFSLEQISYKGVDNVIQKICKTYFTSFKGTLHCGNLNSSISLSPSPEPYNRLHDFERINKTVSHDLHILGFLNMADVASPPALSRHLVIPIISNSLGDADSPGVNGMAIKEEKTEAETCEEETEETALPSFCVLLHGALKVENMVALCSVGDDWYGMLYSFADNKKKSNLMLSLFVPGSHSVPWLGDLSNLCLASELPHILSGEVPWPFPVKQPEKRSYAQTCVVWIRQSGLQADIQKLLRHARKLPEKTQHFYKELNRIRKAAISFGFCELLEGLAAILECECTMLPGTPHPECAIQLSHAASFLRGPQSTDLKYSIVQYRARDD